MSLAAIKELLFKVADDQLILGHRNSEWTGLGPLLEEDIAFSSMAQDKIGQSLALYTILHELGEAPPDTLGFMRNAEQFRNCIFVELPNGEYDFSLMRHFLYDNALAIRFDMLSASTFEKIAELSVKIRGELKYHTLHANTWIRQLGSATAESVERMQRALQEALPYAVGMFEESTFEQELISEGIFAGEKLLLEQWKQRVETVLAGTQLVLPDWSSVEPVIGGRSGNHSEHLQPLLNEMSEVLTTDPDAEW